MEKENAKKLFGIVYDELDKSIRNEMQKEFDEKCKKMHERITKVTDDDMIHMNMALTNLATVCDWNVNNIKKYLFSIGILGFENGKYIPKTDSKYIDNRIHIKREIIKELYNTSILVDLKSNDLLDKTVKYYKENKDKEELLCYTLSNADRQRTDEKFENVRILLATSSIKVK